MLTAIQEDIISGLICPYCKSKTDYVDSSIIYGVSFGMVYLCKPCDAYCGVYKGTNKSLGRLANKELRAYKKEAHKHFDYIWKSGLETRSNLYKQLSEYLELPSVYTHIGMFGVETCKKVIEWSKNYDRANNKPV